MVKDQNQNYVAEEDPTAFVSEKTGRGPLDSDWVQEYSDACVVSWLPPSFEKCVFCLRVVPCQLLADSPLCVHTSFARWSFATGACRVR